MRLKRYDRNPVLSPNPANYWEGLVTTNPGAWYDQESGRVLMLYRAAGSDPEHRIYFGLAVSDDGYNFTRVSDEPVFGPSENGFDAGCVEDPRIVKFGEYYYITYACRAFPPGEYWLSGEQKRYSAPSFPEEFPQAIRENSTATGLAITKDFRTYIRAGRMTDPTCDDRDVILFPEKIGGRFALMHRPMNWVGPQYGTESPAMWISFSNDLLTWTDSRLLAKADLAWEHGKIGGNTPPLRTRLGWLTIYHAVGDDRRYRLGAMILDIADPAKVLYRSTDYILQPETDYETQGYYPGVVFPCGNIIRDGKLFVYYGGADKYVGVATCELEELLGYMLTCPA